MDVARKAEWKMKDADGVVILRVAYEIQEPVSRQLTDFAEDLGMELDLDSVVQGETPGKPLQTSLGLVMLSA
jgi:hypothetical protein